MSVLNTSLYARSYSGRALPKRRLRVAKPRKIRWWAAATDKQRERLAIWRRYSRNNHDLLFGAPWSVQREWVKAV